MASTYLKRTHGNSSPSGRKGTISVWVKRASLGSNQYILGNYNNASNYGYLKFDQNDNLTHYSNWDTDLQLITVRKFRDVGFWYHIVLSVDTTQSTASDRLKIYVNGELETYSTTNYGNQNTTNYLFQASATNGHRIGHQDTTSHYFDGCMSHFHFVDGTAYPASTFGSTDSTTGEWKINTSPSVTYGSQGYFMLKNDNSLSDDSGNGNNFTLSGTLTKSEDSPSNVFCTINPLDNNIANATLTNGNTTIATGSGNPSWNYITSTLGVNTGKYYWEVKDTTNNSSILGFASKLTTASGDQLGESTAQWGVQSNGRFRSAGSDLATTGTFSFGQNDIVGFALDCDNNKIYISVNGVYGNSGNPSTGANGITIASPDAGGGFGWYFPAFGDGNTTTDTYHVNFGNGYFGTTAVASAGTNASGNGIFEYNCPAGFTALSTKGLNQ